MIKVLKNMSIMSLIIVFMMPAVSLAGEIGGVAGKIQQKGSTILSAVLWCGYAISLGMIVFIGIKYILGAADAKANMKSAVVNWLIGAFMVFMCTTIIGWVFDAAGLDASEGSGSSGLASSIIEAGGGLTSPRDVVPPDDSATPPNDNTTPPDDDAEPPRREPR